VIQRGDDLVLTGERFALSAVDRKSPVWRALCAHYTDRLAMLRAKNDSTQSAEQTEKLRGRIDEIKAFLNLADERHAGL
jgi:hypothetical protein